MKQTKGILLLLLAVCLLTACSSDDELTDYQATFRSDVYSIGYNLKNTKGQRSAYFKEGENIIFEVAVCNNTGYKLFLGDERNILFSAMSVFRSDGEFIKNPWQQYACTFDLRYLTVEPHASIYWSCPWIYDERYIHDDKSGSSYYYPTQVLNSTVPLPKGAYYILIKCRILYRIADDPTPGGGTNGYDDVELRIPFIVG